MAEEVKNKVSFVRRHPNDGRHSSIYAGKPYVFENRFPVAVSDPRVVAAMREDLNLSEVVEVPEEEPKE